MSEPNYKNLNESELRQYVKSHPQDEDAFQYYLSLVRKKPAVIVGSNDTKRLTEELQKRIMNEKIEKADQHLKDALIRRLENEMKKPINKIIPFIEAVSERNFDKCCEAAQAYINEYSQEEWHSEITIRLPVILDRESEIWLYSQCFQRQ